MGEVKLGVEDGGIQDTTAKGAWDGRQPNTNHDKKTELSNHDWRIWIPPPVQNIVSVSFVHNMVAYTRDIGR